jgi:hypothetical protein
MDVINECKVAMVLLLKQEDVFDDIDFRKFDDIDFRKPRLYQHPMMDNNTKCL